MTETTRIIQIHNNYYHHHHHHFHSLKMLQCNKSI